MKTIELVVAPNGATTLETKGFAGDACKDASRFLEAALGVKLSDQPATEAFMAADHSSLLQSS
jgi:hypothetical protein